LINDKYFYHNAVKMNWAIDSGNTVKTI